MAELKCSDGTVIKISKETEDELRKAFGDSPPEFNSFVDLDLDDKVKPIFTGDSWENVKNTENIIKDLQKAIEYCKKHNLGE